MRKEGTVHWVQINYDQYLFEAKLGGLRESIRHTLVQEQFRLEAGKVIRNKELKVPVLLPSPSKPETEVFTDITVKSGGDAEFNSKGGSEVEASNNEVFLNIKEECPDILFSNLKIITQDDKWATLEYTITNQGKGLFRLYGMHHGKEENLIVRAYISGVTTLSRGALPIGGQFIKEHSSNSGELHPGESFTGQVKLDIRKKTRYLKSLILSLDSNQFASECDKTNNTAAVILD